MGQSRSRRVSNRTSMKTLFFVAAFVALALGAPQSENSGPSADAEANPDAWYGYYGRGYYGGYYRPYGYGYGYYGKRSADAEPTAEAAASPEAEADPWYSYYGYGGYGHHAYRPYGYGYFGYRPYGYAYWG